MVSGTFFFAHLFRSNETESRKVSFRRSQGGRIEEPEDYQVLEGEKTGND